MARHEALAISRVKPTGLQLALEQLSHPHCAAAISARQRSNDLPSLIDESHYSGSSRCNVIEVSPYLCRPTRHFDLMVGPYANLAKARLRRRQIGEFDSTLGILRVIKVPSGYWVVRQVARRE